ncbi:polysaccharide pyruvyl transferase family protein [Brevibacterium aurantiacum]|uniref:Polysaccharide pyruvyl transferase family protein n=2 Tax=Brevibacterium aurantiacum TaxID=273384 RepID=A0A556C4I4_BREAU|nr:polysaccharide pyruvyl transferase family protein [Brevibacterium aurantiacum]
MMAFSIQIKVEAMTEILLRASKEPWEFVSASEVLKSNTIANNSGNLLFGQSVYRILSAPGVTITPDRYASHRAQNTREYAAWINDSFDHFVIPLANAFRPAFRPALKRLTKVIERLKIPVTVIGVGSQHKLEGGQADEELNGDVQSFMAEVLERSASVGVRGERTAAFLATLGFGDDQVDVIGCPSVFMYGDPQPIEKTAASLTDDSRIAMTISPYVGKLNALVASHTKSYQNLVYVPQNLKDLNMMVWGEDRATPKSRWNPTHVAHPLYTEDRMRFPLDPRTWVDYLTDFDFVFGSRIHGSIAGILAGVPTMLLAHDSRTLELAEYHAIPHLKVTDLSSKTDAKQLYEQTDYAEYNSRIPEVQRTLAAFLEKNGLRHALTEADTATEFDDRLAAAKLPDMVTTLYAAQGEGRAAILDRVRGLHREQTALEKRVEGLEQQVAGFSFESEVRSLIGSWRRQTARKLGLRK